jgi:RimJ/RimL family protein N-acetyltransferase
MRIQLIAIDEQGYPAEGVGRLDEVAKQICKATLSLYRSAGYVSPWVGYLVTHDQRLVGACAFKSAPANVDGHGDSVEIGYLTFPSFEGKGIATEMVRELLRIARTAGNTRSDAPSQRPAPLTIIARTVNEENASNAILRKFGFQFAGERSDPDDGSVWQWELQLQSQLTDQ